MDKLWKAKDKLAQKFLLESLKVPFWNLCLTDHLLFSEMDVDSFAANPDSMDNMSSLSMEPV